MAQHLYFYQDLTQIAEDRIKELIRHAEEMEAREHSFPKAGSYFRDCAVCVYLAWRDVTVGWHVDEDLKRLEALANGTTWTNTLATPSH
jgi:hypothetical protein